MFSLPVDDMISLRLPRLKDANELFALVDRNRPLLRRYLPWLDHNLSPQDTLIFIKESRKKFKKGINLTLCIVYQGYIAGIVGLHDIDRLNQKAEIGYWLTKDLQGKGIMHCSCQALIGYAFQYLQLHRLEIHCTIHNLASQRVAEKLHFVKEGNLRKATRLNNRFFDTIIYSLLRTDPRVKKI